MAQAERSNPPSAASPHESAWMGRIGVLAIVGYAVLVVAAVTTFSPDSIAAGGTTPLPILADLVAADGSHPEPEIRHISR